MDSTLHHSRTDPQTTRIDLRSSLISSSVFLFLTGILQSDISRLTMTMNVLVEENPESWRTDGDEFYLGVRQGLMTMSRRFRLHADLLERRVSTSAWGTVEVLMIAR